MSKIFRFSENAAKSLQRCVCMCVFRAQPTPTIANTRRTSVSRRRPSRAIEKMSDMRWPCSKKRGYVSQSCIRAVIQKIRTTTRTKFGDRAFSDAGPTVWNGLPASVRSAETLASFKCELKTYLFNISFNWLLSVINIVNA